MVGPQTTRDALVAELLGDVGLLLDRVEALNKGLPAQADAMTERLGVAVEAAAQRITQSADQARVKIGKAGDDVAAGLKATAGEAKEAARTVSGSAGRFVFVSLLVGLMGGIIGGGAIALGLLHVFK